MAKVKEICSECKGDGLLLPLGYDGLEERAPERLDVKRAFPRICDRCGGSGRLVNDVTPASG